VHAVQTGKPGVIVDGAHHVGGSRDAVVGRVGVAEIIDRHILECRPFSLDASQRYEALTPVEIGVCQDVPAAQGTARERIEVGQLIGVNSRHGRRTARQAGPDRQQRNDCTARFGERGKPDD
jgi:hypothetical protein